jgi:hypothetical protein
MGTPYAADIVAWAYEQATLLRTGNFNALDIVNLADEIECVARTEVREFSDKLSRLLASLLRWNFEPGGRCEFWRRTIIAERGKVTRLLEESPSLKNILDDTELLNLAWLEARVIVSEHNGIDLPESWIWSVEQALDRTFSPD